MSNVTATAPKKGFLGSLLGGGKSIWALAVVCAVIAAYGALTILGNAASTTTYYVLGQSVAARTQITAAMLVPVTTSNGTQPRNAYDPAELSAANSGQGVFAKIALNAGDIVTTSNSGSLAAINAKLPAGFVAGSFQVTAENAVAGKVRTGDYIDVVAVVQPDNGGLTATTAKVVLHHVLVLDVTVDPSTIADAATSGQVGADVSNPGPESSAVRGGIPSIYTVALSSDDAVKLALVRDKNLMVVLSSNDAANTTSDAQTNLGAVIAPDAVGDSGAGTESATAAASASATPANGNKTPNGATNGAATGSAASTAPASSAAASPSK